MKFDFIEEFFELNFMIPMNIDEPKNLLLNLKILLKKNVLICSSFRDITIVCKKLLYKIQNLEKKDKNENQILKRIFLELQMEFTNESYINFCETLFQNLFNFLNFSSTDFTKNFFEFCQNGIE